jgi:hypothetical protein
MVILLKKCLQNLVSEELIAFIDATKHETHSEQNQLCLWTRYLVRNIELYYCTSWKKPLTEMSTRNLKKKEPGGKVRPARRADNLAAIC